MAVEISTTSCDRHYHPNADAKFAPEACYDFYGDWRVDLLVHRHPPPKKHRALVVTATWAFCLLRDTPTPPLRPSPPVFQLTATPHERRALSLPPHPLALEGLPYPVLPCAPRLSAHFGRRFRFDGRKKSAPPKEGQRGFLSNKEPDRDYSSNVPFTTISPSRII